MQKWSWLLPRRSKWLIEILRMIKKRLQIVGIHTWGAFYTEFNMVYAIETIAIQQISAYIHTHETTPGNPIC